MGWVARRWALLVVLLVAGAVFLSGENWGLPSRAIDPVLFGPVAPWSGEKILSLSGGWQSDETRGADVARRPLPGRDRLLELNDTDAKRAQILVRYRLYSYQPDEMITFRALSGMRPGHGPWGGMDPRLYQYGGVWIYPVGLALRIAGWLGLLTLRGDVAFYLDHPEAFGRFYIVARLYSALWGLVAVAAVFALVRRIGGGWGYPAAAAVLVACLPVVVNGTHEAKPHVAGAALILLTALAGSYYVQSGNRKTAILTGALAGAATGMVLSAYPAFLIIPAMMLLRRPKAGEQRPLKAVTAITAIGIGVFVYFLTNPYVAVNLLVNRPLLRSNLGNSAAMYHAGASSGAVVNGVRLIYAGCGGGVAVLGFVGACVLAVRAVRYRKSPEPAEVQRRAVGLLLATPAVWIGVQFFAFAAAKPGEYGRFALYLDIVLAIEAVVALSTVRLPKALGCQFLALLIAATAVFDTAPYVNGFLRDSGPQTSRHLAARVLDRLASRQGSVLVVESEPAPYCLPPVDLFRWRICLSPRGTTARSVAGPGDIWVEPGDDATPLSWANKPFRIGRGNENHF
jgi:hypothetical protein